MQDTTWQDYGEYATSTRGGMTTIWTRNAKALEQVRWYTNKDTKATKEDIKGYREAGELHSLIRSYLVDPSRRANQMDYEIMKNIWKAVSDSKASSEDPTGGSLHRQDGYTMQTHW